MAKVQFVNPDEGIRLTNNMESPKKISCMRAWFRKARKAIPEIPDIQNTSWYIGYEFADIDYIRYDLIDRNGIRAYVVIFRHTGVFGSK